MESEKVKEIKKALENCQKNNCLDCPYFIDEKRCKANDLLLDTITLINELESENERLRLERDVLIGKKIAEKQKSDKALIMKIDIQEQLKDRIAELEEGIAKSMLGCEFLPECTNEKLKQFAERLKERLYNFQTWEVPYNEWCKGNVVCGEIDETLKEFIKD